jgi:enolase-phosphatase E1
MLLDVEGTTTPARFVYGTLYRYALRHLRPFLVRHAEDEGVRADLARLREEHDGDRAADEDPPAWREDEPLESAALYAEWLTQRDRKATGWKALQGRVWEDGYRFGTLQGAVYQDVPRALERWRGQGKAIAIFSSGSVLAQRLLFAHSTLGDLTPHLSGYYDTTSGHKREPESYARIARDLGCEPARVLFLSDVVAELDAALGAGLETALCVREDGQAELSPHPVVRSFDEVSP